jgi:hypothetical protein
MEEKHEKIIEEISKEFSRRGLSENKIEIRKQHHNGYVAYSNSLSSKMINEINLKIKEIESKYNGR